MLYKSGFGAAARTKTFPKQEPELLHHFSKIKVIKKSQNSRNQGFSYYICLMLEGSRSRSVPLTNGSGSRRPKNIRILRIRIRTRINNCFLLDMADYYLPSIIFHKRKAAWRPLEFIQSHHHPLHLATHKDTIKNPATIAD